MATVGCISPGTIISNDLLGTSLGYSPLWTLLFVIFATRILQEVPAALIIKVIAVGNATPQGGNEDVAQVKTRHTQYFRRRPPQSANAMRTGLVLPKLTT